MIKPAHQSVRSLLRKVREIVRENRTATAGHLIVRLNPVIHGWANYHRHVVSKEVFVKVDSAIFGSGSHQGESMTTVITMDEKA